MNETLIETLDDGMTPDSVGWKFARLKTLQERGVRVPGLFCLTGAAYHRAVAPVADTIDSLVRNTDLDDWDQVCATSARIREVIAQAGLGPEVEPALERRLAADFPDGPLLAVRASVIGALGQGEDSARNPFAGMSDSFLYVPPSGVKEAVLKCWASAFSPEGLLYRHRQGLPFSGLSVAVGVQRMVFGERSLVLFTCDPTSYARNTVISASWGIGEGVVQEKAPVDHYFVHSRTGNVESVVARKTTMVTLDRERGHGTVETAVASERVDVPVLSDEEARSLAALGRDIEKIFGEPQDIEATFTEDGLVHVVQSRPVTIEADRHRIWSSANVSESFPDTTTPMTYSVARRFYWLLNHDYLRRSGVPESELHDLHETMTRLLGFMDNRIYHSINAFITMLSAVPMFDSVRRDWERLVAELDTFYHHTSDKPTGFRARGRRAVRLVTGWGRVARAYQTLPRDFKDFQEQWSGLLREVRTGATASEHPLKLVADYRHTWRTAGRLWGITLVNYQFMVLFHKAVELTMDRWGVDEQETLFSQLLCGGRQLKGAEIALSAVRLAERVRADAGLHDVFLADPPRAIWDRLEAGRLPREFTEEVRRHIEGYGDRGIAELKLEKSNLRDTPWELIRLVQQYAASDLTVADMEEVERETRLAGEALLRSKLPRARLRRAALLGLFDRLRTTLYYREVGRYMRSELFGYSKQVIRALGAELHRRDVLGDPEDVFFLDLDELFGFVDGTGSTRDLAGLVAVRRRDLEKSRALRPVREFATGDVVATSVPQQEDVSPDGTEGVEGLRGLGSCPGKVRGYARVLSDPALDGEFPADSILITRETDPGWLYLMLASKGIVVERGSLLSHTAITGRKFGIPTIVGVPDATRRIPEGSLIEVDGGTGSVVILDEAPR
ncbi:phosphoenolpyruvate synthase [Streptomyces albulus]|uniref:PEP/pyruvate-binding domain-containing protein n=1 Tax=Streptomyces noursei TaxID=1971 RepID=UPI001F277379|nr:PEP/pyruvate-binding domain-containing protein [Streptomyces noursei]MCE4946761.1 phosphoenolpyruvate synthase [Streptomyces noursei]